MSEVKQTTGRPDLNGTVNVLKPPGMTSAEVVAYLRRLLKIKRVGHTGTLDPGVAGVLPVCTGQATRMAEYFTDQGKAYRVEVTFGIITDTQDAFGEVLTRQTAAITVEDVERTLARFCGTVEQIPPMYSAVRQGGKHLYEYARQGVEIERQSRQVQITDIRLLDWQGGDYPRAVIEVQCSKGTYIRTLCHDIGQALGCGAHMSFLLRLRSGPFQLEHSWTLEEITTAVENFDYSFLRPLPEGLELPLTNLPPVRGQAFLNGLSTKGHLVEGSLQSDGTIVQVCSAGSFLGIGVWRSGSLVPYKVLTRNNNKQESGVRSQNDGTGENIDDR